MTPGARSFALPIAAILVFAGSLGLTLSVAGNTLGFDFLCYHLAVQRLLAGQPVYDLSFQSAGPFGLFYYPPTFIPFLLPFGLLGPALATWAWIGMSVVALLAGIALLPVERRIRWVILLLAGLSWPVMYALKLGQVGPLLFLLFAAGWRGIASEAVVGVTGALGAAIKIQPGLVLAWALLTRRWRAVGIGAAVLVGMAAVGTLAAGIPAWTDFLTLARRVADPITTPHNTTVGALLYQAGLLSADAALVVHWISVAVVLGIFVVSSLKLGPVPSYLVALIASQLILPIIWDHYAMLLLIPIAWLLDRGHWWAVVFALLTPMPLAVVFPPVVYGIAMWGTLASVVVIGAKEPRVVRGVATPGPASPGPAMGAAA